MQSQETVLVIGAGIAGLCTALSLAPTGRQIMLVERDGEPPANNPDAAFRDWRRTGVGHLRQSHAFLARLRNIIKADHPELLERLAAQGVRDLTFSNMLTPQQQKDYVAEPGDAELTIITSRRTTLELIMRDYVLGLPNVSLRSGFLVKRLRTERLESGALRIDGVIGEVNGSPAELRGDIVVDASGKSGFTIDQLTEEGVPIAEETESAGILYFTRHYRLRPGRSEPDRNDHPPASGDLGYMKFGVFPADNGNFSITIAIPEVEHELRKSILNPDIFHKITLLLPGLRPWTNETQAEAMSKVFGMGDLNSRWRELGDAEKPSVHGYFAMGDTLVRTNPLYGRGCSFAAVSADTLRSVLQSERDPGQRTLLFKKKIREELRPYYENMLKQDRSAIKRARNALIPDYKPRLRARLLQGFVDDGVRIAARKDVALLRDAMRGFHMLEHPDKWLAKPGNLFKVLYTWARGKKHNAAYYPPEAGPDRTDMMSALSLDHQADMMRAAEAEPLAA